MPRSSRLGQPRRARAPVRCTLAAFRALRPAQATEVVPDLDPTGPHNPRLPPSVNILPMSPGVFGAGGSGAWTGRDPGRPQAPEKVTVDSVPAGEEDIPRISSPRRTGHCSPALERRPDHRFGCGLYR